MEISENKNGNTNTATLKHPLDGAHVHR